MFCSALKMKAREHESAAINIILPIEEWIKIKMQKTAICLLTRCIAPNSFSPDVPNQPSPDKTQLCLRLPRALKARLEKLSRQRGVSVTELVEWLLQKQTKNVELSADDYRKIADDIEKAKRGRK